MKQWLMTHGANECMPSDIRGVCIVLHRSHPHLSEQTYSLCWAILEWLAKIDFKNRCGELFDLVKDKIDGWFSGVSLG